MVEIFSGFWFFFVVVVYSDWYKKKLLLFNSFFLLCMCELGMHVRGEDMRLYFGSKISSLGSNFSKIDTPQKSAQFCHVQTKQRLLPTLWEYIQGEGGGEPGKGVATNCSTKHNRSVISNGGDFAFFFLFLSFFILVASRAIFLSFRVKNRNFIFVIIIIIFLIWQAETKNILPPKKDAHLFSTWTEQ